MPRSIDITDLPEPFAKALELMVAALRTQTMGYSATKSNGVADFDRALDDLFAEDGRSLPSDQDTHSRAEIYEDHD